MIINRLTRSNFIKPCQFVVKILFEALREMIWRTFEFFSLMFVLIIFNSLALFLVVFGFSQLQDAAQATRFPNFAIY